MSQYYYQKQRGEDIASLQAMFGPPWTHDLLGVVLDYYDGNVDQAVTKLLALNEHCGSRGSPHSLVEDLLLSNSNTNTHTNTQNMNNHFQKPPSTKTAASAATKTSNLAAATLLALRPPPSKIPKSKMKKPPPPRRSQVAITMADTFESAVVTIDKQTRRRMGIPVKLPDDFLRIPKVPLFREDHLDHLINMPPPSPLRSSSNRKSTTVTTTQKDETTATTQPPSKFRTLRVSMNFSSISSPKNSTSNNSPKKSSPADAAKTATTKTTPTNDSSSTPASILSGALSVPKLATPKAILSMPKLAHPLSTLAKKNSNDKPMPPSPPGPPPELFARANEDGDWFTSSSSTLSPTVTSSLTGNNKNAISTNVSAPESAPDKSGRRWSVTLPIIAAPSMMKMPKKQHDHSNDITSAKASSAEKNNNSARWSLPAAMTASSLLIKTTTNDNNAYNESLDNHNVPQTTDTNSANESKMSNGGRWSNIVPRIAVPSLSANKNTTSSTQDAAASLDKPATGRRFFLSTSISNNDNSNKKSPTLSPGAVSQEQAIPPPFEDKKTAPRWSLATIATLTSSTKQPPNGINSALLSSIESSNMTDTYGVIPQIKYRGVTVRQLQELVQDMRHQCVQQQWKSTENNKGLQPRQVTMYDFVKHYILPKTQANACSFVEQAYGKYHHQNGLARPPQWFVSHTWSDSVMDVVQCIEQHAADRGLLPDNNDDDPGTAAAATSGTVYWICALAMNQHAVATRAFIGDTDTMDKSSLQNPVMTQMVMQVTEGTLCVVDKKNVYYSRIWCLWEFFLALERAKETMCLDSSNDVFIDGGGRYLIDVYTTTDDGDKAVGLTDGPAKVDQFRPQKQETNSNSRDETCPTQSATRYDCPQFRGQLCNQLEWSELRALRQSQFRFQACIDALDVHLESAQACLEEDTRRVMNCIVQYNQKDANHGAARFEGEAWTVHPAYSKLNALVQGTFAGMAYRRSLEDASGEKGGEEEQDQLRKVQIALATSSIESLEVSFAGCSAFQIREALKFVESLPTSLRRLDLDYSYLEFQYAEEFAIGFGRLSENLEFFKLNCGFCSKLENLDRLWEELGKLNKLKHLVLVIHPNKNLTSVDGLATAVSHMPKLEKLELEFDCFGEYSKLVAMAKGGATLNGISSTYRSMLGMGSDTSRRTKELSQQFDRVSRLASMEMMGNYISDSSIQRLCKSLTSRVHDAPLSVLKLRFLGDFGKKLKNIETVEDLQKVLQRVRNGLKLFS